MTAIYVEGYTTKKHPLYKIWDGIRGRCLCPTDRRFKNYGARGIKMCDRWQTSFADFVSDMGPRPSKRHSIDRRNNDGDYCPENCRWATSREQTRNARYNRVITAHGKSQTMTDWSAETGLANSTILNRLKRGWTEERAVSVTPKERVPDNTVVPEGFAQRCKELGLNENTIYARIRNGWTLEKAFSTPVDKRYSHNKNIGRHGGNSK